MAHRANKVNAKNEYQIGVATMIIRHYLDTNNGAAAGHYLANLDDGAIKDEIITRMNLTDVERGAMNLMTRRDEYALEMALRAHADNKAEYRWAELAGKPAHYNPYKKVTGKAVDYYLALAA